MYIARRPRTYDKMRLDLAHKEDISFARISRLHRRLVYYFLLYSPIDTRLSLKKHQGDQSAFYDLRNYRQLRLAGLRNFSFTLASGLWNAIVLVFVSLLLSAKLKYG